MVLMAIMTLACASAQTVDKAFADEVNKCLEKQDFKGIFSKSMKEGLAPAFAEYGLSEDNLDSYVKDFMDYVMPGLSKEAEKAFSKYLTLEEMKQINAGQEEPFHDKLEKVLAELDSEGEKLVNKPEVMAKMVELLQRYVQP